jgi:molybdopterin synthase catalytic subunit
MKLLGIVGSPDSGRGTLSERLVDRLSDRGGVAMVTRANSKESDEREVADDGHGPEVVESRYISEDGDWTGAGRDLTLDDALASLAPTCDYALVEGFPQADMPTVAVGGREHAGETIASAPDAEAVDLGAVLDAVEDREDFETLESLVADLEASRKAEYAGAITTFTGRVRGKEGPDDAETQYLEFERYDEVAAQRMATIREELEAREGIHEVRLHHRTGVVPKGEDVVYVAVLAGHRAEGFETVEDGIDRIKDEVPLFKKEVTEDGEFWAHDADRE